MEDDWTRWVNWEMFDDHPFDMYYWEDDDPHRWKYRKFKLTFGCYKELADSRRDCDIAIDIMPHSEHLSKPQWTDLI